MGMFQPQEVEVDEEAAVVVVDILLELNLFVRMND